MYSIDVVYPGVPDTLLRVIAFTDLQDWGGCVVFSHLPEGTLDFPDSRGFRLSPGSVASVLDFYKTGSLTSNGTGDRRACQRSTGAQPDHKRGARYVSCSTNISCTVHLYSEDNVLLVSRLNGRSTLGGSCSSMCVRMKIISSAKYH